MTKSRLTWLATQEASLMRAGSHWNSTHAERSDTVAVRVDDGVDVGEGLHCFGMDASLRIAFRCGGTMSESSLAHIARN